MCPKVKLLQNVTNIQVLVLYQGAPCCNSTLESGLSLLDRRFIGIFPGKEQHTFISYQWPKNNYFIAGLVETFITMDYFTSLDNILESQESKKNG